MEPWRIEQLRRSVAMLPPGHSVGVMSREQALDLFEELARSKDQAANHEFILSGLRRVLAGLDHFDI